MANAYFYSNVAIATTLSASINASDLTCTVGATTGWPTSYPFVIAIDFGAANEELVKVTNNSLNTLTIVRAFGGTTATTHSLGAVVRHVYNSVDATDFRTHEAATAAVHGVTGSVVGTTDTQTLTNKTLSSPTVNTPTITNPTMTGGGSLAGTYTGTPTFSGAVVLSGTPNISNGAALAGTFTGSPTFSGTVNHSGIVQSTQSASGNVSYATIVTADTFDRFRVYASGIMEFGPGNAARDVNLYRSAANVLSTDDQIRIFRPSVGDDVFGCRVAGDAADRILIDTDSTGAVLLFGSGTGAPDTNLYRESNGVLKTDGGLKVGGALTNSGFGIQYKAMQAGTETFNMSAVSQLDVNVTFATAFDVTPNVVTSFAHTSTLPAGSSALIVRAFNVTTTGMTLRVNDVGGVSRTVTVFAAWHAIRP